MFCLVCDKQDLKIYFILTGEPVMGCEDWCDVGSVVGFDKQPGCRVLHKLQMGQGYLAETGVKSTQQRKGAVEDTKLCDCQRGRERH